MGCGGAIENGRKREWTSRKRGCAPRASPRVMFSCLSVRQFATHADAAPRLLAPAARPRHSAQNYSHLCYQYIYRRPLSLSLLHLPSFSLEDRLSSLLPAIFLSEIIHEEKHLPLCPLFSRRNILLPPPHSLHHILQ